MPVVRRFLTASLIAIALPSNGSANCEVGGYAIHTIASYKDPDPRRVFLRYSVTDTGDVELVTADSEGFLTAADRPFEIRFGSASCQIGSGITIDPNADTDDDLDKRAAYQDVQRLSIGRCDWLVRQVPSYGYLLLDTVAGTYRFPGEIRVNEEPPRADRAKKMAAFVDEDLRKRSLSLSTRDSSATKITPEMIDGRRSESTAIGRGDHQLVVHVEVLRIRGLESAWTAPTENEWGREERERFRLETGKADFPVVYFLHPSRGEPVYFGDGSLCSPRYFERYPEPQQGAEGAFDRFRVTRAFDLDLDGIVDVLEVNGQVAYWLDPLKAPEVIHWNMAC